MSLFTYTAATKEGKIKEGEMEVALKDDVFEYLRRHNLFIISVREKPTEVASFLFFRSFKNISVLEKVLLTRDLSTMIEAGVSLPEAVNILAQDIQNPYLKGILNNTKLNLEKGLPLSYTLASYPEIFSKIFLGFVKTGEVSGALDRSLSHLSKQLKKEYDLSSRIKEALTYPMILIVATVVAAILIVSFVLPKLATIFLETQVSIPWFTRVLLRTSQVLGASPFLTLIYLVILAGLIIYFVRTKKGRKVLRFILSRIPKVRELFKKINIMRFARTLGWLLKSGMSILEALDISSESVESDNYRKAILGFRKKVKKGVSLSNIIKKEPKLFPRFISSMIRVGEEAGAQEKALLQIAKFYEEETDVTLRNLVTLIEPVLLLLTGLFVAGLAFSIVIPIYQMITAIGG